jgi:AraC family transcriptional regulator
MLSLYENPMDETDAPAGSYHGYDVAAFWSRTPQLTVRRLVRAGGAASIPRTLPGYRVALSLARNDAWLSIGGRVCTSGAFPAGTCVLGQPGEAFDGEMRGPADVLLFLIDPSHVGDRLDELGLPRGRGELLDLPAREDLGLSDIASRLVRALDGGLPGAELYCDTLVAALTERIIIRHATLPDASPRYRENLAPARLRKLIEFISSNLGGDLRLSDLALGLRMSQAHLARAFRQATGMPLHRYVLQRRLEQARDLITHEGLAIGAVARQCGFFDAAHLCRAYKAAFGVTPSRTARF